MKTVKSLEKKQKIDLLKAIQAGKIKKGDITPGAVIIETRTDAFTAIMADVSRRENGEKPGHYIVTNPAIVEELGAIVENVKNKRINN